MKNIRHVFCLTVLSLLLFASPLRAQLPVVADSSQSITVISDTAYTEEEISEAYDELLPADQVVQMPDAGSSGAYQDERGDFADFMQAMLRETLRTSSVPFFNINLPGLHLSLHFRLFYLILVGMLCLFIRSRLLQSRSRAQGEAVESIATQHNLNTLKWAFLLLVLAAVPLLPMAAVSGIVLLLRIAWIKHRTHEVLNIEFKESNP